MEKAKKGTDRGVVVQNPLPDAPENIGLSKAAFVEKERARKEKELKIAAYSKQLDEEAKDEGVEEAVESKKSKGRPKKIE